MKSAFLVLTFALSLSGMAHADVQVPNCWAKDTPNVLDGLYVVDIAADGITAADYANILAQVQGGPLHYLGDGSRAFESVIEIDLQATVVSGWRPSLTYPTFAAIQGETLAFLTKLANMNGVSQIRCVPNSPAAQPM